VTRGDCLPPRLSSHAWNSRSQPVGATSSKTSVATMIGSAAGDPSGVINATRYTPTSMVVAQATATTAFLLTGSVTGSGGWAPVGRTGMSAVRAARSA
jgi:hypothetical protein